jgi:hypothetical protein
MMIRRLIAGLRTSLKLIDMSDNLDKDSTIKLDIKSLVSIVIGIVSIAGVWFTLTAQLSQLQLDVIRMQDAVGMNSEFRVKWPRGELGALPDDAKQDLRIEYLQKDLEEVKLQLKKLKEGK